jgi:hypothetical protein
MAEAREGEGSGTNSFIWPSVDAVARHPLLNAVTGMNGKLMASVESAQNEWAEFVHRRVKEDIAASYLLLKCRSFTDMQEIYSRYLRTAFEQYRDHSERVVQRGKSMTAELAQTLGSEPAATRTRN